MVKVMTHAHYRNAVHNVFHFLASIVAGQHLVVGDDPGGKNDRFAVFALL